MPNFTKKRGTSACCILKASGSNFCLVAKKLLYILNMDILGHHVPKGIWELSLCVNITQRALSVLDIISNMVLIWRCWLLQVNYLHTLMLDVVDVYHVTIVAMDMGCWRNFGLFGNKQQSTHCREFLYVKLCRPAYFVKTTQ